MEVGTLLEAGISWNKFRSWNNLYLSSTELQIALDDDQLQVGTKLKAGTKLKVGTKLSYVFLPKIKSKPRIKLLF